MKLSDKRISGSLTIILGLSSVMVLLSSTSKRPGSPNSIAPDQASFDVTNRGTSSTRIGSGSNLIDTHGTSRRQLSALYDKLPLSFEKNQGQFDPRVKFASRTGGQALYLTESEAVLVLNESSTSAITERPVASASAHATTCVNSAQVEFASPRRQRVVRIRPEGADPQPQIEGDEELPMKSNYFIGQDRSKWRTDVPAYARVRCRKVYPGVDLAYYGTQHQLEFDFILEPGTDTNLPALTFEGADEVRVDAIGDLILTAGFTEIRQHKPVAYQEVDGIRKEIAARYVQRRKNLIGFEVAAYDSHRRLVIDPVLAYSSYLGGGDADTGEAIAVDSAGNAYVTGNTRSMNFPTTPGAFQTIPPPFGSVFVTKINPSGAALVYSTYLGSGESHGIAVDSAGSAYVVGTTAVDNFPTTGGAFDTTYNGGGGDAFVTKLSPTGSALLYSTYLGGSSFETGDAIAVDTAGNAHVTGITTSADFRITPGAFQSVFRGGRQEPCGEFGDAFVTKLNAMGTGLLYSTFLGGSKGEGGFGIAVDSAGFAYVTGSTGSDNFPTSQGAFQTIHGGCIADFCTSNLCEDAFVTKLNPTGTEIVYSSYLGGIVGDAGFGIAVDFAGNALVTGSTTSFDFPRSNPIQSMYGGFRDVFVAKVNATGSALVYSTFLGSSGDEEGFGIAVDSGGNAYVTGHTTSANFPTLSPIRPYAGSRDAFVLKLSPSGSMLYSTYLGGSGTEGFRGGIAVDPSGNAYVTGTTQSTDFPATAAAFQRIYGGGLSDAFVAKISDRPPFDVCLQDESNGNRLQFNSSTGDYQFTNCQGITIGGTGLLTKRGCLLTLQVNGPDRRLLARSDTCMGSGIASIQLLSQGTTFTIMDRNTANDTCACSR
jgi:hypothetical protein